MTEIPVTVPRQGANDDTVVLVEWKVPDGSPVRKGQVICALETSKAIVDHDASDDGWLFHRKRAGEEIAIGGTLAVIRDSAKAEPAAAGGAAGGGGLPSGVVAKFSKQAEELIARHQLDRAAFAGLALVRGRDVEEFLARRTAASAGATGGTSGAGGAGATGAAASAAEVRQRRVAKVLSLSHSTIPHSYLHRWLDLSACEGRLKALENGEFTGSLSDLLALAVAQAAVTEPAANAQWMDERIQLHPAVNLGFALNLKGGSLVVPVIPGASLLSLDELAGKIRGVQKKSLRDQLTPADLTGGTITVTSMFGTGVHSFAPLIVPGQSCIVGLADVFELGSQRLIQLTVAFDHRVMNGSGAARFLMAVAERMTQKVTTSPQ